MNAIFFSSVVTLLSQEIPFEAEIDFTAILKIFSQVFQTLQENFRRHVNSIS